MNKCGTLPLFPSSRLLILKTVSEMSCADGNLLNPNSDITSLSRRGWPRGVSKPSPFGKTPSSKYLAPPVKLKKNNKIMTFCLA